MRILFYTHRFGRDMVAGAELHLYNLAEQMALKGHEVVVATTRQKEIAAFMRFGLRWSGPLLPETEEIPVPGAPHPIRIHRFKVKNLPKIWALYKQKKLQRRWEREEMGMEPKAPLDLPFESKYPMLLTGWQLPEFSGGKLFRWSMPRAAIQFPSLQNGSLHLQGHTPRNQTLRFEHNGRSRVIHKGKGGFQISVRLDDCSTPSIGVMTVDSPIRPLKDCRTLGCCVTQMSLSNRGRIELAPFNVDHRTIRAADHDQFIRTYTKRAEDRPEEFEQIFDQLRGPICPGMEQFLERHYQEFDWVLAGIFPFANLPAIARFRADHGFRLALLPLFHVDDDFYYWNHYIRAMRAADVNLANSWYSGRIFFPTIQASSILGGAGVNDQLFLKPEISGERFRKKFHIPENVKIVLSVGRKSGPKRYRTLLRAVDEIQHRAPCRLILVGPDEDNLPIASPNCSYLGVLSWDDLLDAYDACDVFALMSESESFGMVFVEAWMRKKPVVGNSNCAPVSYLIKHEVSGLLARDREELGDCLVRLLKNPKECKAYGEAGFQQAIENHTWPVIAERILKRFEPKQK
jgi:glycosyltransferase involved in cell wall biosynthesis